MESEPFTYVWHYTIDLKRQIEFLDAYRSDGEWAQFFSRDPAYIRTELFHDSNRSDRYMTVDYWMSKKARDAFREKFSAEFSVLDKKCEEFTLSERFVGDFVVVGHTAA